MVRRRSIHATMRWAVAALTASAAPVAAVDGLSTDRQFQFIWTQVKIYGNSASRSGDEGPSIQGDAFVADVRTGAIFHCLGKFVIRIEKAPDGAEKKRWSSESMRCLPTFDPTTDPTHYDYAFAPVSSDVDANTYISFFRLNRERGAVAFCALDEDTIMRCSTEAELK